MIVFDAVSMTKEQRVANASDEGDILRDAVRRFTAADLTPHQEDW